MSFQLLVTLLVAGALSVQCAELLGASPISENELSQDNEVIAPWRTPWNFDLGLWDFFKSWLPSTHKKPNKKAPAQGVVMCYLNAGAIYRSGVASFGVDDVPLDLCTHLIYSFVAPTAEGEVFFLVDQVTVGEKSSKIEDYAALKKKNPNVKLLVAMGGWTPASTNFTIVVNDVDLRAKMVKNMVAFLKKYDLDGFDLDWEYPNDRGGVASDKSAFVQWCKELKAAFTSNGNKYLLTAAVGVTQFRIDTSYDPAGLDQYLDYINLMTYDYHGSWESTTGANAPLFDQLTDPAGTNLNVNYSVYTWLQNEATRSKLVLGLPTYGKTWTLTSADNNATAAPTSGAGAAGRFSQEAGTYSYLEICTAFKEAPDAWTTTEVTGNYAYTQNNLLWIGYDSPSTIYAKGRYAKESGLAGILYWSLDNDDFSGACTGLKYPLVSQGVAGFNSV